MNEKQLTKFTAKLPKRHVIRNSAYTSAQFQGNVDAFSEVEFVAMECCQISEDLIADAPIRRLIFCHVIA